MYCGAGLRRRLEGLSYVQSENHQVTSVGIQAHNNQRKRIRRKTRLTITVDGAVCTGLLAVTLDLFSATFVAGSGDSTALLYALRRNIADGGTVIEFDVRLDAIGRRGGVVDSPVRDGQRGGLVVRHVGWEVAQVPR